MGYEARVVEASGVILTTWGSSTSGEISTQNAFVFMASAAEFKPGLMSTVAYLLSHCGKFTPDVACTEMA